MLTFDEEKHLYFLDDDEVPSVTQIISAILGQSWMAADWYLQRGRAVHACAALIAYKKEFNHDSQIDGQVEALRRFFAEVKPDVILCEHMMVSETYRFAGTPDLICFINGKRVIVDFKASYDIERLSLQLGAYAILFNDKIIKGCGVEIRADGTYRMSKILNLRQARREFLALRAVYGIKDRMNILEKGR